MPRWAVAQVSKPAVSPASPPSLRFGAVAPKPEAEADKSARCGNILGTLPVEASAGLETCATIMSAALSLALAACALTAIQQCPAALADVPGVVIAHRPASTREFIGSPSLAILPDGSYVASHDLFGPGSSGDRTVVFASEDRGQSWSQLAEIQGQWWSTLFFHQHALYLIGTSKENGFIVIRRSSDRGKTWTTPR